MSKVERVLREHPGFLEGRREAEAEIARGELGYRVSGKINFAMHDGAASELASAYGVKLQVVGHCIVPLAVASAQEGYNERMAEELVARFGCNVVDAAYRTVERRRKRQRS